MLATGLWPAQCALPGATVALDAVGELVVLSLQLLDLEKRAPVLVSKSSEVFRVAVDETDLFHEAKQTPGVDVHEVPFHLADRHDVEEFHRFLGTVDRLAVAAHQNVVPQQRRLVADRLQPTLADTLVGSETQGRAMKADDLVHLLSHRKHASRALRWQPPTLRPAQGPARSPLRGRPLIAYKRCILSTSERHWTSPNTLQNLRILPSSVCPPKGAWRRPEGRAQPSTTMSSSLSGSRELRSSRCCDRLRTVRDPPSTEGSSGSSLGSAGTASRRHSSRREVDG